MKLTQRINEESKRVISANHTGSLKLQSQSLINKGYKPYTTQGSKLIPITDVTKVDRYTNKTDGSNFIFFLSDEEVAIVKRVEDNITQIIEQQNKQRNLMLQYLPAFINEYITKQDSKNQPSEQTDN